MYLSKLKITNFRKYGNPGLEVSFNQGLNVLIGENESGKSTIIDAIRYVLQTQSFEFMRFHETDFHCDVDGNRASELKIECEFTGFTDAEAGNFLEWIGFDENKAFILRVWVTATLKDERIIKDIRAGMDDTGALLDGWARDLIRVTYLKPLRDAELEMSSGRRSRFAQLLKSHEIFQKKPGEKHKLEDIVKEADEKIQQYFGHTNQGSLITDPKTREGKVIIEKIEHAMNSYTASDHTNNPFVSLSGVELWAILQRLSLQLDKNVPSLGLMNLLYMAAEFLLLKRDDYTGLKLALVEELEAHLHPHYQLNVLQYLIDEHKSIGQTILTTHSVILGSSIPLENLIICKNKEVYPMGQKYTKLDPEDYLFLERFLDATKANLFFAKGVIIVEGDSENMLVPALAEVIGLPLNKYGVSIVNVGSKAWKRYANIFLRKDGSDIGVRVAVVSDGDVPCREYLIDEPPKVYCKVEGGTRIIDKSLIEFKKRIQSAQREQVKKTDKHPLTADWIEDYIAFIQNKQTDAGPSGNGLKITHNDWTLEYSLAKSGLKDHLLKAMEEAHNLPGVSFELPKSTDTPFEIMSPFLSNLSKALTAQILAKRVRDAGPSVKVMIEQDAELSYIVTAVKWACGNTEVGA